MVFNMKQTTTGNKYIIHIFPQKSELSNFNFISLDDANNLEPESIEAIYIHDLLDYIDSDSINKIIRLIKSKLINNGKLYLQGTDIKSLSASLLYGQIDILTFKSMVYGLGKKSTYSVSDIKQLIKDAEDLKIISIEYINASQYYIECMKNE